jgi:hypothetical protein
MALSFPPSGPASNESLIQSSSGTLLRGTRTGAGQNVPQTNPDVAPASAGFVSEAVFASESVTLHLEWFSSFAESAPK